MRAVLPPALVVVAGIALSLAKKWAMDLQRATPRTAAASAALRVTQQATTACAAPAR